MLKAILTTGAIVLLSATTASAQTSGSSGTTSGSSGATTGAQQLTQAECQAVWSKAGGATATGGLSSSEAQAYVSSFTAADTNKDGKLSNAEFTAACQKGLVHDSATTGAGSGSSTPGSSGSTSGSGSTTNRGGSTTGSGSTR